MKVPIISTIFVYTKTFVHNMHDKKIIPWKVVLHLSAPVSIIGLDKRGYPHNYFLISP